jgi:ABC-type polysaccharide/polyol phosphate export permease
MFVEQLEYRELLFQMTLRDLLLRYKQTVMGFGWAIFMPLVNTVVFSVIFTRVARIDTPIAYPLFAYCGFLVWNFFAASLRFSVLSLTSNTNLVQKVYFPREIFPFSAILVCLVDFLVGSIVLGGLILYYDVAFTRYVVLLPVVVAVNMAFAAGVALLLAMSNLFYRDVKYLFEVLITVWMFATTVIYPAQTLTGRLGFFISANPMTQIVEAYRAVLLYGQAPDPIGFGATALLSVVVLFVGWSVFHRAEFTFAENI